VFHDADYDYVTLDRCPYEANYGQEEFILEMAGHYKNRAIGDPLDTPTWLTQGIREVIRIGNIESEREMERLRG